MKRCITGIVALLCAAILLPTSSYAQHSDLSTAPPIRGEVPLRAERHQITPVIGMSFDDPYLRDLSVGIKYRYYFTNWLGVGVDIAANFAHVETSLSEKIEAKTSQPGESGAPSTSGLGVLGAATVTLVPIYGKFMFLGKFPVAYDVHVFGGAGFATTDSQNPDRIKDTVVFSSMFGFGVRFFLSDWIAVEVDVQDYMMTRVLAAPYFVDNPTADFQHNWMVTTGVSFFFPPDLERKL